MPTDIRISATVATDEITANVVDQVVPGPTGLQGPTGADGAPGAKGDTGAIGPSGNSQSAIYGGTNQVGFNVFYPIQAYYFGNVISGAPGAVMPSIGTMTSFRIRGNVNAGNTNGEIWTVYKNNAPTALTVTVKNVTEGKVSANVSFAEDDDIKIFSDAGSDGNWTEVSWTLEVNTNPVLGTAILSFCNVAPDTGLGAHQGVLSAVHNSVGDYTVTLDATHSALVSTATIDDQIGAFIATQGNTGNSIRVFTYERGGLLHDYAFHLIVVGIP